MNWIPAKLRTIRQELRMTQLEMAQASGLSQRDISQLENGRKEGLPKEFIQFLHSRGVDLNWLFTDPAQPPAEAGIAAATTPCYSLEEQPLAVLHEDQVVGYGKNRPVSSPSVAREPTGLTPVGMVDKETLLHYPARHRAPEFLRALPLWSLPLPEAQRGQFRVFQVTGADMAPTFAPDDWVIARFEKPTDTLENGAAYIVVTTPGVLLRRVFEEQGQPGLVLLRAEAPESVAVAQPRADILELWSVRGHLRFTLPAPVAAAAKAATLEAHLQDLLDRVQRLEQGR